MADWYVYMVRCADQSLYTGVTTDLQRRVDEHNSQRKAARYTRVRQPVTLVYSEAQTDRRAACQRESAIKRLTRAQKLSLIAQLRD